MKFNLNQLKVNFMKKVISVLTLIMAASVSNNVYAKLSYENGLCSFDERILLDITVENKTKDHIGICSFGDDAKIIVSNEKSYEIIWAHKGSPNSAGEYNEHTHETLVWFGDEKKGIEFLIGPNKEPTITYYKGQYDFKKDIGTYHYKVNNGKDLLRQYAVSYTPDGPAKS